MKCRDKVKIDCDQLNEVCRNSGYIVHKVIAASGTILIANIALLHVIYTNPNN